MMRTVFLLAVVLAVAAPTAAFAKPDPKAAVRALFGAMEQGFRKGDEAAFKKTWVPAGYEENLVGGSGIPGKSVFRQGSRKSWFLKPDLDKLRTLDAKKGVFVVYCSVWSWTKERAVDAVHALLVTTKGTLQMLGGGEREAEVLALGERYLKGQPLPAPKK
jgi:hypothetical protein